MKEHETEHNAGGAPAAGELVAADTALHLFQIAALMLGNEQEAVSLVEETLARVEADPCAEGPLAYAEARTLLLQTAVQRMAGIHPEAFGVPTMQSGENACVEIEDFRDDLVAVDGASEDPLAALLSGTGRIGMRDWLDRLAPALRAIFVLRAVAGQSGEQTAENLRQTGATGARGWGREQVGAAYRQALCSLATCLVSSRALMVPA